jgi:uncharacterized protein (TIGR02421 family)
MEHELETTLRLDRMLVRVASLARPVPSLTPENAAVERARLVQCLRRGEHPVPVFTPRRQRVDSEAYRAIDEARALSEASPIGALYVERLAELELDLAILDAWGDAKIIRPLCVRRYGKADEPVMSGEGEVPLNQVARGLLASLAVQPARPAHLPARGDGREPCVASLIQLAALGIGLDVEVRVEPRLASLAATGERTVFLADRQFSEHEARRLIAHEVFGHLVVAANARSQPLRLLQVGLAGSFSDQEGLALHLEEAMGLMDNERLRTLSARVVATEWLHAGASFGDAASALCREYQFSAEAAVLVAERTYRGGGVARDAGYLAGYLKVRAALRSGSAKLDELRRGRVSLTQLPRLRELEAQGFVLPPVYRPSLALSRRLTLAGTSADTSPPSEAASLTMLELT